MTSPTTRLRRLRESYLASLKSLDTEETIDVFFYRPIGYMWARLAMLAGVTPNAVTVAAIVLGCAAGVLFYSPVMWVNVCGMALLVWANSYDSADGQLARMTGNYSRLGRILDGLCGDLWFITIYVAVCLRENAFSPWFAARPWVIWTLAVAAGACHSRQAALADYYRQFHLYALKGDSGSELDSSADLRRRYERERASASLLSRLTMRLYIVYTSRQEGFTPAMQRLRALLRERYGTAVPQCVRERLRAMSRPLMKYTNILTFNWRVIVLFVCLAFRQPWIYFVAELTAGNVLLLYMRRRHEAMCRKLCSTIENTPSC